MPGAAYLIHSSIRDSSPKLSGIYTNNTTGNQYRPPRIEGLKPHQVAMPNPPSGYQAGSRYHIRNLHYRLYTSAFRHCISRSQKPTTRLWSASQAPFPLGRSCGLVIPLCCCPCCCRGDSGGTAEQRCCCPRRPRFSYENLTAVAVMREQGHVRAWKIHASKREQGRIYASRGASSREQADFSRCFPVMEGFQRHSRFQGGSGRKDFKGISDLRDGAVPNDDTPSQSRPRRPRKSMGQISLLAPSSSRLLAPAQRCCCPPLPP